MKTTTKKQMTKREIKRELRAIINANTDNINPAHYYDANRWYDLNNLAEQDENTHRAWYMRVRRTAFARCYREIYPLRRYLVNLFAEVIAAADKDDRPTDPPSHLNNYLFSKAIHMYTPFAKAVELTTGEQVSAERAEAVELFGSAVWSLLADYYNEYGLNPFSA